MKIITKINLGFILVFIFILLIVGLISGNYSSNLAKRNAESFISSSGRARAEHIRTFIQDEETTSVILAAASVYRDLLKEATTSKQYSVIKTKIDKRLIRTIEADPHINEAFILDTKGKIIASSDKTQEGIDKSGDPYFLEAKDGVFFKDVYFSTTLNKLTYTISSPVKDDDGSVLGISVLRYLPSNFFSIVKSENGLGETEENFLINKDKILITPTRFLGEKFVLKKKIDTQNAHDCFDSEEVKYIIKNGYSGFLETFGLQVVEAKDYRNIDVLATHYYIPETGWCLITKVDKTDVFSFVGPLIITFSMVFFVAVIVFLLVGLVTSKRITIPLNLLKKAAKKIEQGDYDYETKIDTDDEIEELSSAFNAMSLEIKKSKSEIEEKIEEQTKELEIKTKDLEEQKGAIMNILEDVEKEKDKSEELANDLEKFKLAVDSASDQIVITDHEGIVIYGNKSVERITGYTVEEYLGKKAGVLWKIPMPIEYYKELWDIIKTQKKVFIREIKNRRKNGEYYIASIRISPVLDDNGEVIFFVAIENDVTKAKEIDKEKTEFVSLASHQLKTPVGAIRWNLEMLLDGDYGAITDKQKEVLNDSYIMNLRMNELINALLNVSRIETGVFIIEPTPTNFVPLCEEVLKEMEGRIKDKGHKLIKEFDDNLPVVPVDTKLLRIIFQNFISNSIKYTQDNGEIKVAIKSDDKDIFFSVENNGEAIPESDQSKIFEKMFRASNAQGQDVDGNGLGLYIVKQIVDNSGGKIWFTSKEGEHTIFACSFPLSGMIAKSGTRELN